MSHIAAQIIKQTTYAAIASSNLSNEPWNTPVYIVYDEHLNFYWASSRTSRHSLNIKANPKVFLVIYDSTVPWGTGKGVFIQAEATEISNPDVVNKACRLREFRSAKATRPSDDFIGEHPRRIYQATPKSLWINRDGIINDCFVDERVEIDKNVLRKLLAATN